MPQNKQNHWLEKLISFIGFFIFLLGIYASTRTVYNILFLKKYPLSPVISFNPFYSFEEDCYQQYSYPFYDEKGRPRPPTDEEEKIRRQNIENCLKRIEKQRQEIKQNDIWISIFLLFLGGGVLLYTKKKF